MTFRTILATSGLALLAACSGPATLYPIEPAASTLTLRASVSSAMVRTVSLPSYAASDQIAVQSADGSITTSKGELWADEPGRAVTLIVSKHLNDILSATVAPEPWPFAELPDVNVDIRVERMLAGADGQFRLTGQFYTGGDGISYPNRSQGFDIAVPIEGEGFGAIAAAQARALLQLSEQVARALGR